MKLPIRYTFQAFQKDQFWLPAAMWALFALMTGLMLKDRGSEMSRGFLGFVMPLLAGGLGAYAVLQDSALELQFATDRPSWRMLVQRLGLVLVIMVLVGLSYQLFAAVLHVELGFGPVLQAVLIWLVPCVAMVAVANLVSLLAGNSNGGFAFVGTMWILQLMLRGWIAQKVVLRNFLLFMGAMAPGQEVVPLNQLTLTGVAVISLLLSWLLLKKQERYI